MSSVELRAILRDEISAGLKGIQAELEKVGKAGRESGDGIGKGQASALPSVQGVTDALGRQVVQLRAQRDAMGTAQYQAFAAEQKKLRAEIEALEGAQNKQASGFAMLGTAVKGFMALQVVGYLKDIGGAVYEASAEMDSLRRGMTAVMHSSSAAAKEMEALREVAKLPGLGYSEAVRMSVSLQAAGMSANMARESMMAFGNALATVGKGKADLEGVGLALSQIMSKGKVSAEEINQIAERVPQIRIAMKDAFGTADTEVIQKMKLTSQEFIAGVTAELGKLDKATGGLRNSAENLSDAWFQLRAQFGATFGVGDAVGGVQKWLSDLADSATAGLKKMEDAQKEHNIRLAMENVAYAKEQLARGKFTFAFQKAEYEKALAENRAILAKYADTEKKDQDKRTDGQKRFDEAMFNQQKASREKDLEGLRRVVALRTKEAEGEATRLAKLANWEREERARINKEWDEKEKPKGPSAAERKRKADAERAAKEYERQQKEGSAELERLLWDEKVATAEDGAERQLAVEDRRYREQIAKYRETLAQYKGFAALMEQAAQVHEDNMARIRNDAGKKKIEKRLAEIEKEENAAERKRDDAKRDEKKAIADLFKLEADAAKDKTALMGRMLGNHNATITSMLKGEQKFADGTRQMWDDLGTSVIGTMLELAETWVATEIEKALFSEAVQKSAILSNAVTASALSAEYAVPAALASTASFGGAATAGAAGLAGTVAMANSLAMRENGGFMFGRTIVGEKGPEAVRPVVPSQVINNHHTTGGSVTYIINASGSDAKRIRREIERSETMRKRGSR